MSHRGGTWYLGGEGDLRFQLTPLRALWLEEVEGKI